VAEPDRTGRGRQLPAGVLITVAILVLAPFVALLWVSSYAKVEPRLWGFPFFYWYQFLWVFIASGSTSLAYVLIRNARRGGDDR
jgi:membrane protein implicated in regulation of membrane protease activity